MLFNNRLLCSLTGLVVVVSALVNIKPSEGSWEDRFGTQKPLALGPIKARDLASTAGLRRRAEVDFSQLDLQSQSRLLYGATPGEDGDMLIAEMVMYAKDGVPIVLMEGFEDLTSEIDCNGDDGVLSMTFASKKAFDRAVRSWTVINEREEDKFLLIANHDRCGPGDDRQPYVISNVSHDSVSLVTTLAAQPVEIKDVAATYDLNFGKVEPLRELVKRQEPAAPMKPWIQDMKDIWRVLPTLGELRGQVDAIAKSVRSFSVTDTIDQFGDKMAQFFDWGRDTLERLGETAKDALQLAKGYLKDGEGTRTGGLTVNLDDVGSGDPMLIYKDPLNYPPRIIFDCRRCEMKGIIELAGRIRVEGYKPTALLLDAKTKGVEVVSDIYSKLVHVGIRDTSKVKKFPKGGKGKAEGEGEGEGEGKTDDKTNAADDGKADDKPEEKAEEKTAANTEDKAEGGSGDGANASEKKEGEDSATDVKDADIPRVEDFGGSHGTSTLASTTTGELKKDSPFVSMFKKPLVIDIIKPIPIPTAGISIGNFLRLGATLKLQAIFLPLWVGIAEFDLSLHTVIPDTARLEMNFLGESRATGFDNSLLEPKLIWKNVRGIMRLVAIIAPTIEFGLVAPFGEFVGLFNINPEANIGITPIYKEEGACKKGGPQAGAEIGSFIFYQGHFATNAKLEKASWLPNQIREFDQQVNEYRLWQVPRELGSTCVPFSGRVEQAEGEADEEYEKLAAQASPEAQQAAAPQPAPARRRRDVVPPGSLRDRRRMTPE